MSRARCANLLAGLAKHALTSASVSASATRAVNGCSLRSALRASGLALIQQGSTARAFMAAMPPPPTFASAPVCQPALGVSMAANPDVGAGAGSEVGEGESDGDGVADISEKVTATLPRCTDGPPWPSRERRRQGSQYHYKSDQLASNGMAFMGYSALGAYRSFATAPSLPQLEAAAVAAVAKTSKTRIPHIGREAAGHLAPHPAPRVDGSGSGFEQAVAHESAEVAVVTPEEFMAKHSIRVVGDQMEGYQPCLAFEEAGFPKAVTEQLYRAGFKHPSPIQAAAWPIAMGGRDMVAIAPTGSGKTVGFLLPAVMHIQKALAEHTDPARGPMALILAPTRELAVQIQQEAEKVMLPGPLTHGSGPKHGRHHAHALRSAVLYGGAPRSSQIRDLRRSPHLVIATPGRLLDFDEAEEVNLSQVSYLVLDEADRMLDMGFEDAMRTIVARLPLSRQTSFFSATWPPEVQKIARSFAINQPLAVFIGDVSAKAQASKTIEQRIVLCSSYDKPDQLRSFMDSLPQGARVIVFVKRKSDADVLAREMSAERDAHGDQIRAVSLHGDKPQSAREYALQTFRQGRSRVLVATDVAARGIDVPNVHAVVNYDFPNDIDMYVHRIGRTGRAGAAGLSMSFVTPSEAQWAAAPLAQVLRDAGQAVPQELEKASQRYSKSASRASPRMASKPRKRFEGGRGGDRWGGRGRGGGDRADRHDGYEGSDRRGQRNWRE